MHKFTINEFIKITIDLIFNQFSKNIQHELSSLKFINKRIEVRFNSVKILNYFLRDCASITSKACLMNPLRKFPEEMEEMLIKHYKTLMELFYIVIQKRFKRVAVDKSKPGYLLLIAPDDCYLLLDELSFFSDGKLTKEHFKEILSIVLHVNDYNKHLTDKYELNSKGLL